MSTLVLVLILVIVIAVVAWFILTQQQSTPAPAPAAKKAPASGYYDPHTYDPYDPAETVKALAAVNPRTVSAALMKIPPAPKPPTNYKPAKPIPIQPGQPVKALVPANRGPWGNKGFLDWNALWIGPRDDYPSGGPNGTWSYYKVFYVPQDTTMRVWFQTDDSGEIYVDGEKIGTHADAWWQVDTYPKVPISEGYHLAKVVGSNLHGGPYGVIASFVDNTTGFNLTRTDDTWTWVEGA